MNFVHISIASRGPPLSVGASGDGPSFHWAGGVKLSSQGGSEVTPSFHGGGEDGRITQVTSGRTVYCIVILSSLIYDHAQIIRVGT